MSIAQQISTGLETPQPARKPPQEKYDPALSSSASIEEIHDARVSRSWIRLIGLALLAFLVWACLAPVPEMTSGFGEIAPAESSQHVQHLEGGQVAEIFVKEGDRVERGQPIMRLNDLSVRAELAKALSKAEGIRLEIERRTSGSSDTFSVLDGPLRLRGISGSQQAAAVADEALQDAQIEVAQADVQLRRADLSSLNEREAYAQQELDIVSEQLVEFEKAVETVGAAKNQRDKIARDKIQLENTLLQIRAQRASGEAALAQAEAHVRELQAGFRQASEAAVADLEIEGASADELVRQLQDRVDRTLITAPDTGRILGLIASNPGQVITPGQQIATLIPEGKPTLVDVEIPADQIGFIAVGMAAHVKVLTFDYTRFGTIPATVASISASSLKRDDARAAPYFQVRLALDPQSVNHLPADRPLQPGMSVMADIKLGEKSVMSFLLKPLRSLSDRALTQQ